MKILMIGSTGDISKAAFDELSPRHDIIEVSRSGAIQADISNRQSIIEMYKKVGNIDAVVCTAGNVHFGSLTEFSEDQFMLGLKDKVMGQINLALEGLNYISDGGSFTLTTGVLNRDPIRMGAGAATANGAIDGFVIGSAIEMPRHIRINVVSPGLLEASEERYGEYFPGHERVSAKRVGLTYAKSVEGPNTGKVIIVE
jgi:NAD(P)-dependent dehydrogenase (short-subunit alcohol dehydrogenase family)